MLLLRQSSPAVRPPQASQFPREIQVHQKGLDATTEPVATTIVTVEEIMRGWMAAIRRERDPRRQKQAYERLANLFRFFAGWDILPWDDVAIAEFEQLFKSKIRTGTMDLKIASIALAHDAAVLTCNVGISTCELKIGCRKQTDAMDASHPEQ
jgi:tRNA(fMet)-specific endonuclease VapC